MTLFFPDLNVWLALSVEGHTHNTPAWRWLRSLPEDSRLIFSRYTQIGLLRLLTNSAMMSDRILTVHEAWKVYDGWLKDPRVEFQPEPRNVDAEFREALEPLAAKAASKWVGDCWLLAFAAGWGATLVTFDRALFDFAWKWKQPAVIPR
ncbi:MAG: TA system VapC family ribonuclease toxin [Acidobacteriaceae bacterium]